MHVMLYSKKIYNKLNYLLIECIKFPFNTNIYLKTFILQEDLKKDKIYTTYKEYTKLKIRAMERTVPKENDTPLLPLEQNSTPATLVNVKGAWGVHLNRNSGCTEKNKVATNYVLNRSKMNKKKLKKHIKRLSKGNLDIKESISCDEDCELSEEEKERRLLRDQKINQFKNKTKLKIAYEFTVEQKLFDAGNTLKSAVPPVLKKQSNDIKSFYSTKKSRTQNNNFIYSVDT